MPHKVNVILRNAPGVMLAAAWSLSLSGSFPQMHESCSMTVSLCVVSISGALTVSERSPGHAQGCIENGCMLLRTSYHARGLR